MLKALRSKETNRFTKAITDERGMTLIEIMIVIAIIAGLMAVLGNQATQMLNKSRVSNTKIQIKELGKQLEAYNLGCNSYPTTDQGLQALVQSPGESCPNWGPEPYLKKVPKDSWSRNFLYESDGSTFVIRSLGKDGKEGGDGYAKDLSSEDAD